MGNIFHQNKFHDMFLHTLFLFLGCDTEYCNMRGTIISESQNPAKNFCGKCKCDEDRFQGE